QTAADAGHDRVVDRGMAERASDAKPRDAVVRVHCGPETHNGIHLQQRDRRRWTLEIDFLEDSGRERVRVHLEPNFECRCRVYAFLHHFMQTELVSPDLLVAKGIESEDLLSFWC